MQGIGYLPGGERSSTIALTPDGATIFGVSTTNTNGTDPNYQGPTLFLWNSTNGMTALASPYLGYYAGGTISADAKVASINSSIFRIGYSYFFDLEQVLIEAGAGSAIDGWSDFGLSGITDDGNTAFGAATNPDGKQEGFIVQFPPDYLRTLIAPLPEITSPLSAEATMGEYFSYIITADGIPDSYGATDLPDGLEFSLT